jgi:hypothetical protein
MYSMNELFNPLVENGTLERFELSNGLEFRLKLPIEIIFTKKVIDFLKLNYVNDGEKGGMFVLKYSRPNVYVVDLAIFVQNASLSKTSYVPVQKLWANTFVEIINSGNLPIAFHTHPTELGLSIYDNRTKNFFIRASAPDRKASKLTTNNLVMPECIFVANPKFQNGFGMSLYGGKVLPDGFSRLSPVQFAAIGATALNVLTAKSNIATALGLSVAAIEERRRPKYQHEENGDYRINAN